MVSLKNSSDRESTYDLYAGYGFFVLVSKYGLDLNIRQPSGSLQV